MALVTNSVGKGWCSFPITGQVAHTADAAGSVGYIVNPEADTIIVTRCVVYYVTGTTGVANLTVGSATTIAGAHDGTNICAADAAQALAAAAHNGGAWGDPADALAVVPAGSVIAAFCSADSSGLAGTVHIEYIHA